MSALNPSTIIAQVGRDLQLEDMALLKTTRVGSETPKLKRIRSVHHAAARLMATGMKQSEVSMNTGLCPSRLSILKNDPAFDSLVQHYASAEQERFASVQDRMAMLGMVAAEELQDRIVEGAEEIATRDLTDILRHALDRGGYAPVSKSETKSTHVVLSADDMLKIKQQTQENSNGRVIHRRPTKTLPSNPGADSISDANTKGAVAGTSSLEGITLEGLDL